MTMINTFEFEKWAEMPQSAFVQIGKADETRGYPLVHVVTVPEQGFAILSTSGVYVRDGKRAFNSYDEVVDVLRDLGIKLWTHAGDTYHDV